MLPGAASTRYMRTQDASAVPLHLNRCDLAERTVSLNQMSDRGKGNLGDALGAASSQDQVVTEGELGHDRHLDAVLALHGRSPRLLCLYCGVLLCTFWGTYTFSASDSFRRISHYSLGKLTFTNLRHWCRPKRKGTSLTFQALGILKS